MPLSGEFTTCPPNIPLVWCYGKCNDSELTCPVLVAHQMSASSGFVLLWDCGRRGGVVQHVHRLRRRADLGGVFRISDRSVLVVAADAARPVEERRGSRRDRRGP